MHDLSPDQTIYEALRQPKLFPVEQILEVTDQMLEAKWDASVMLPLLKDTNPAVRFWAAMTLHIRGWEDGNISAALKDCLEDPAGSVRLTAAQALCSRGDCSLALPLIWQELNSDNKLTRLLAARTYQELGERAAPIQTQVDQMTAGQCPQEDWSYYYELYTCWALLEAQK